MCYYFMSIKEICFIGAKGTGQCVVNGGRDHGGGALDETSKPQQSLCRLFKVRWDASTTVLNQGMACSFIGEISFPTHHQIQIRNVKIIHRFEWS